VENLMKSMAEVDKVSRSGQWQLKAAAITGVMALVGTLIAYFVN